VADSSIVLDELLDLKMLPAWVNEPAPGGGKWATSNVQPDSAVNGLRQRKRPTPRANRDRRRSEKKGRPRDRPPLQDRHPEDQYKPPQELASRISVSFSPHPPTLESIVAQIKENAVAYSIFALARLFLTKPERYDVCLTAGAESPLFQLGDSGAVSVDRQFLERNAFRFAQSSFYRVDITQSEPIKGNFTNVARCKLNGTLLGPTNHHDYQKRLRNLFEQRFSRRMRFADYQRQIEIVSDPVLVEQWKEEARKITTYSTLNAEAVETFASATDAERHFRQNYLPGLIRATVELTIDGPTSRRWPDRALHRLIEDEWSHAMRSPSHMMQELAGQFRQAGLHIFRHRRGMLFVSPIRARPLAWHGAAVSPSVNAIIETLGAAPRTSRKELADKLIVDPAGEEQERAKLALASDLHWLIREGHVIEFNDGSLDLPRVKAKSAVAAAADAAELTPEVAPAAEVGSIESRATDTGPALTAATASTPAEAEIGSND
jgi:hypothetical protein